MVVAEAGRAPKLIKVTGNSAVVSELPGDYTNPKAQQEAFQYPTEALAVNGGGFRLTNYQGRIYDVAVSGGAYDRVGPIQDTGLSQVLRSSYDISTDTWYLSDWGAFRIAAVRGTHQGDLTVKALGYSVLEALPVAGDGGKLYAVAQRMGADEADFGFFSWDQTGISPTITTQPTTPKVSLGLGDVSKTAVLTAAATGDPSPTLQWQTRPVGSTSPKAWTAIAGETSTSTTVSLTEADHGRQYRALVSNAAGQIATEAVVAEVQTAPAIVFQPESADVTEGDDAQFLVMPKGNPYPTITWQRRVGGYWQDLSDDDDNFVINGGTLTVKDSNADQSGSVFRARLRNDIATVYSRTVTLSVAEPSDAKRDVASGDLAWGVKESFRKYIGGPIAHGTTTVAGGASIADDGTFRFPVDSGSYDPKTKTLEVEYDGSVHFTGHAGALDLKISDPRVEITGDKGVLVADVVSKSLDSTELTTYDDVELAALDAKDALTAGADALRLVGVGAAAHRGGSACLRRFLPGRLRAR
ncbi:HtaA domain-containing protein [Aeromicrobium sp. UC242_57]|uniref:HtaA domain-containing protein n=1 Tax=Aeromicrobium sp. UC242_57 TaxID=3374624 RepID=UPI0037B96FD8